MSGEEPVRLPGMIQLEQAGEASSRLVDPLRLPLQISVEQAGPLLAACTAPLSAGSLAARLRGAAVSPASR